MKRTTMKGWLGLALAGSGALLARAAGPVEFSFRVPAGAGDPLAREIWAEVVTPSGKALRLPAFFAGAGLFEVRARADEPGRYRLGEVSETKAGEPVPIEAEIDGPSQRAVTEACTLPMVRRAPGAPPRLMFATGGTYVPIGADLAWAATDDPVAWYREALQKFAGEGLNWTRIWMAHWGGLNLDWLAGAGTSPRPGGIDPHVAASWDAVLGAAEKCGVYVQVVLQHHGQYSTGSNSNWAANPWNAANPGGFLRKPEDFFTSDEAVRLTQRKYRYIVARWGYSPAVLAWELFNEVHWVDALAIDHNVAAVAHWHDVMAKYIRSIDVYHHLVTTSTEDLGSPIYASMDYFQPHLYATNMLAAARRFDVPPGLLDRPVFYGEMGDDHMQLSPGQAAAGVELAPIVWASLMGEGRYPAQVWEGDKLIAQGRLGELGAVARFLAATGIAARDELKPFAASVEGGPRVARVLEAGEAWHRRAPQDIRVTADGRPSLASALVPRYFVGSPDSVADGFPDRVTLRIDYPVAATAKLRLADAGKGGASVRVSVDGRVVAGHTWPAVTGEVKPRPAEVDFPVSRGEHTIQLRNTGGADWFEFQALDFGFEAPALAAVGKRGDGFIALWVWRRDGVYALEPPPAAAGTLRLEHVPAGRWRVTWWDTLAGKPAAPVEIRHPGGVWRLPMPPVSRHAAVVLVREAD